MLLAKVETVYTYSGDPGSSMVSVLFSFFIRTSLILVCPCYEYLFDSCTLPLQFVFNMDQGIPLSSEWLIFNRVNARARQGFVLGPACFLVW